MAEDRIDSYIDLQSTEKETQQLLAMLSQIEQKFDKLDAFKLDLGKATGTREVADSAKRAAKELDELELNMKAYQATVDQAARAQARLNAIETDAAKQLERTKQAAQERTRELKNQVAAEQAAEGSIKQLRAQLRALQSQYDSLSAAERNAAGGQQLLGQIQGLDKELKALEGSTGRFQRNVGNYTGAVKTLERALEEVKNKLEDYNKSGNKNSDVVDQLVREQSLLEQILGSQANGFASLTQELKANERALIDLKAAGLEDSEAFRELFAEIATAKDELAEFKKELQTRGSGELALEGAIQAAQTLTSIYGIAEGAAAIFGEENEQLQKTMVKLQAVVAILNGLEALNNALKKENALRTSLNVALQKVATLQTNLQTAAESKNIIVKYAAIAAQKALNLAMSAAGGPLLAIIGLIALMVISLRSFAAEVSNVAKSLDQLTAELDRDLKSLENYSDFVKRNGDEIIAAMEAQFASEAEIRKQRTQNLRDQLQAALELETEYRSQVEQQRAKLIRTLKKNADDLTEEEKKQIEQQDDLIQKYEALQKKRQDLATQVRIQILNNEKATTEESIKARQDDLEALKIYLQMKAADQSDIVSGESLYYKDRIAAAREFQKLQERIINADANKQLLTPGLTPAQIRVVEAQRSAALAQIRKQTYEQILHIRQTYIAKERELEQEANKMFLEDQEAAQQRLLNVLQIQQDYWFKNLSEGQEAELKSLNKWYQQRVAATREGSKERQKVEEEYARRRADIEYSYALAALKTQIEFAQKVIDARKAAGQDVSAAERELSELRIQLSDLETQHIIDNEDRIAKARQQKLDELANDIEKIQDVYGKVTGIIGGLIDGIFAKQQIAIQKEIDDVEKRKDTELKAIDALTLSEQEKADKIIIAEANAQTKREGLERRQRQLELQKARFEKARIIGEIILNTALAVVKALPNIPLALVAGTLGAAQLAVAIAQPLPQYKDGREGGPAEWAITGDGGKPEVLTSPDMKRAMLTPATDTVTWIPQGWNVFPDVDSYYEAATTVSYKPVPQMPTVTDTGSAMIAKAMTKEIRSLKQVVKNKQETHIQGSHAGVMALLKYGNTWVNKIDKKVNF